jgi:putative ABC transport system ATP-binding protein
MADALIVVEGVKKTFHRGGFDLNVLDGIDLTVERGAFLALMGPSGSGKTTLLNLIAGIDRPTAGRIVVEGTDIAALSERALTAWRARHVGFVFQLYHLIPVLTRWKTWSCRSR